MKPAGQGFMLADGGRLAGQHEEGGLKGVFGVLEVTQDVAANAKYHRSVTLDQGGEGRFVALRGETLQQLAIG
jgi:hypothetical protein